MTTITSPVDNNSHLISVAANNSTTINSLRRNSMAHDILFDDSRTRSIPITLKRYSLSCR
jgi:hypothetical protein